MGLAETLHSDRHRLPFFRVHSQRLLWDAVVPQPPPRFGPKVLARAEGIPALSFLRTPLALGGGSAFSRSPELAGLALS